MSAASSELTDSQLRSKKRRYSALELLTISPSKPEDAKRPRILEVDDDDRSAAAASTPSGSPSDSPVTAAEDLADAPRSSSASEADVSPTNKLFFPAGANSDLSAEPLEWRPSFTSAPHPGLLVVPDTDDQDLDDDYTSSAGSSDMEADDASTSSSSSSSDAGSRADYDDGQVESPFDGHFSNAPATPSPLVGDYSAFVPRDSPPPSRRSVSIFATPEPPSDLQERLRAFLPALSAANAELEGADLAERSMELEVPGATIHITPPSDSEGDGDDEFVDAHDGSQVIEMDLGLGVLEERRPGDDSYSSSSSSASSDAGDGERDVLGRLLGSRRSRPDIQVMSNEP